MNRRVTLKDIAAELGLSPKAVSTGLTGTGRLAPATREKILEAAHRMGYTPNAAARALVTRRSDLVGVLVPYLNASFFSRIIAGIEEAAYRNGMALLLGNSGAEETQQEAQFERMLGRGIDGLIVFPNPEMRVLAPSLRRSKVPAVQLMNHFPEFGETAITVDNFRAGEDAAKHLLSLGHNKLGMLAHDGGAGEVTARHEGFASEVSKHPGAHLDVIQCAADKEHGCAATLELLSAHPEITAIFAACDFAALGAVRAALTLRRRIPEELAVVGFDDVDIASEQLVYPLSTLAQPKEQLGELAMGLLLDRIAGKPAPSMQLRAQLLVRATTRRP